MKVMWGLLLSALLLCQALEAAKLGVASDVEEEKSAEVETSANQQVDTRSKVLHRNILQRSNIQFWLTKGPFEEALRFFDNVFPFSLAQRTIS